MRVGVDNRAREMAREIEKKIDACCDSGDRDRDHRRRGERRLIQEKTRRERALLVIRRELVSARRQDQCVCSARICLRKAAPRPAAGVVGSDGHSVQRPAYPGAEDCAGDAARPPQRKVDARHSIDDADDRRCFERVSIIAKSRGVGTGRVVGQDSIVA